MKYLDFLWRENPKKILPLCPPPKGEVKKMIFFQENRSLSTNYLFTLSQLKSPDYKCRDLKKKR